MRVPRVRASPGIWRGEWFCIFLSKSTPECLIGSGGIHISSKRLTSLFQSTNQKYQKIKGFLMKWTIVLLTTSVLLLCVFFAGCTSPSEARIRPFETPVLPIPSPIITTPSTSTVVSTPQALETLPYEQTVDIDVTKQRPDATIHLIFNGGIGEEYVQSIMMRVTRSGWDHGRKIYYRRYTETPSV